MAVSFSDYDLDGDQDLYVANDFGRNRLWRNDGGKFTDVAEALGVQDQAAGMGVDWGDINGDGRPDLYVSNMYSSAGRRIAYQPGYRAGSTNDAGDLAGIQRLAQGNSLFVQNSRRQSSSDQSDSCTGCAWDAGAGVPSSATSTGDGAAGHLRTQRVS